MRKERWMTKQYDTAMQRAGGRRDCLFLLCMILCMGLSVLGGCGESKVIDDRAPLPDTGLIVTDHESYDSADTAILMRKNDDRTLTFYNLQKNRNYTLSYDGTTGLYDKYGESLSLEQISEGTLVDVTFFKPRKRLVSLKLSQKAWTQNDVEKYDLDFRRGNVSIGAEMYQLSDNVKILSDGRQIEEMDLNESDILGFQGIDNTVYCIQVQKGHGYLRLVNDENFIGGWIEIGQSRIYQIVKDMMMTVPEGSYQVGISLGASGGEKQVSIYRNQETALDIGDLEVVAPQKGVVIFSVTPETASLYIDGEQADIAVPVTLEYGIHQLIVKKEGYKTITQYMRVGQASAGIDIALEKLGDDEEDDEGDATGETDISGTYQVYIDSPGDAEVYLDGNYIGISPCSFKKEAGTHVILLRRSGYEMRSYTIQLDDEEKDVSFSFAALVPNGFFNQPDTTGTGSSNTGSSNTGSSNTGSGTSGSGSNTGGGTSGSGSNTGGGTSGSGSNTGGGTSGSGSNTGSSNTGSSNTGSSNTGSSNTGSSNTGSANTGTL